MTPNTRGPRAAMRRRSRLRSRFATWASALTAAAVLVSGGITAAHAETVYEIEGKWAASTPAVVAKGDTVVSEWRFNINDDAPAPGNETIPNTTVTFSVAGGIFTVLPSVCLTDGVTPASEISTDGTTLTCNLGDRDQGTAELVLTGIQITGATGDKVSITGSIGGQTATTPELDIVNPFAMDMKWDQGSPASSQSGANQVIAFPWSLRHAPGSEAGPGSVTYRITVTASNGENVVLRSPADGGACTPISTRQPQHPYSGTYGNTTNRAPWPDCTIVRVGATNQYDITISNIDYSKAVLPKKDSTGTDLSTAWDVVASGMVHFSMAYASPGTFAISVDTPTYTSAGGATSADDPANNTNSVAYTRGQWNGGWMLRSMNPPVEGTQWTDTYRQMAGQPALAVSSVRAPQGAETSTEVCTVLDTKYVTFDWAKVGTIAGGVVTPYAGTQPTVMYFTGTGVNNVLNPNSANYDPNGWQCNTTLGNANWSSTPPADLSTVKAVHVSIPPGTQVSSAMATLYTMTTIKPGVAIGQDIYTWTSYRIGAAWQHLHRSTVLTDKPDSGVFTGTGARYPYTGGGRDVLRVVGARPVIDKVAGQAETVPGATVGYTVKYRAESPANTVLDEYVLVDVLPLGTTYEPGSATIEPTSVTTLASGRTELRWVFGDLSTNTDYFMHYNVVIPDDAEAGTVFVNNAAASIGNQTVQDTARVRIREGGSTYITKTALQDTVPHVDGVANGGWTVRLTSEDTARQNYTDTIDVLPYVGDGRGTDFTGSYKLSGPVDISGMPAGTTVYYTTSDPAVISDDPKDASNGAPNDPTGNTVGWSPVFNDQATAVRVIGGILAPGKSQSFTINVVTEGASYEDVYVNRAQAVTNRTNLVMRTSDLFDIAAAKSLTLKKYVQDADGTWHDAQNIDDYPGFVSGSRLNYRLVVTNTGDVPLNDVQITDDKVDLAGLDPLPAGLGTGAVIAELLPGEANAVSIEYTVPLAGVAVGGTLVNNACALPSDADVTQSCDPAGIKVLPSTLAWTKVAAGTTERLSGSEWSLTPVNSGGTPTGAAIAVTDCVEDAAASCTGADKDHRSGEFLIGGLGAGRYMLVETKAPAGYQLDNSPRFLQVAGETRVAQPIENRQQPALIIPLTGGPSTDMFLMLAGGLGAVLAMLAAVRLYSHRRREALAMAATAG